MRLSKSGQPFSDGETCVRLAIAKDGLNDLGLSFCCCLGHFDRIAVQYLKLTDRTKGGVYVFPSWIPILDIVIRSA